MCVLTVVSLLSRTRETFDRGALARLDSEEPARQAPGGRFGLALERDPGRGSPRPGSVRSHALRACSHD